MKEKFTIFLDIDGVLNSWDLDHGKKKKPKINLTYFELLSDKNKKLINHFHLNNINIFNDIIDFISKDFIIEIVIISSWRNTLNLEEFQLLFKAINIKGEVKGVLERDPMEPIEEGLDLNLFNREVLISSWIENNNLQKFIILDDENFGYDKEGLSNYFYKTNILKGLNEVDLGEIKNFLLKENYAII